MSDGEKIRQWLKKHRPTKCPTMVAEGGAPWRPRRWGTPDLVVSDAEVGYSRHDNDIYTLAVAKLSTALMLLARHGGGHAMQVEKSKAQQWILDGGRDFRLWCEEARVSPTLVQERAREILAAARVDKLHWRRESRGQQLRTRADPLLAVIYTQLFQGKLIHV